MHHRDFGNIRWIAKNDVFRVYMGPRHPAAPASFLLLPLPHHAQIATDSERTIQLRRDFLVDGRFESIPVKVAIKMIATTINNKKAPEIAAVILPALLIVRFLIFFLCQS